MDALILVVTVLVVSAGYGVVALAVLINGEIVPPPAPDQWAAWLCWRRHVSPDSREIV
ncbi:MAG: hypothetical protein KGI71_04630 [Patescibacteria group bacterium]|nr:hypothetical protein [Patescibacteria group bacterium]